MDKPNCYECKWRKDCMGSAHSQCINPTMNEKLREIIEECIYNYDGVDKSIMVNITTFEIKSLIKSKLKKRPELASMKQGITCFQCGQDYHSEDIGFNLAITEIEKIAEEL